MNRGVLICVMLLAAAPARGQGPVLSTAPAQEASPLMLNFSKDARMSRVGLDYAVKWDFSDLASFKPGLGAVYSGLRAVTSWDITENTRVEYYGFKANPWRLIIISKRKPAAQQQETSAAGGPSPVVRQDVNGSGKSFHFSLSPLVDDLRRSFDTGLSDFLLRNSLRKASPEWERMGQQNRKAVVRDVLALPIWETPVPGVGTTKEGLEYISK